MFAFFTAPQNMPFAVGLGLLLFFLLMEVGGLLFGADVNALIGDGGIGDIADAGLDTVGGAEGLNLGLVTGFLYWLNVGRVPVVILFILFLTFFVVVGYTLQYILFGASGHMLPWYLAAPAAFLAALPAVRAGGRVVSKIIPKDETEVISRKELVGSRAVIVLGTATLGGPAQARTSDRYGASHYVMVEPDDPAGVLETGRELLLVRFEGGKFYAIPHPDPH